MTGGVSSVINKFRPSNMLIYNTKGRTLFIAADGHSEKQLTSDSSNDRCAVVNRLVCSKYIDNCKLRLRVYQSTVTPKRTEQNYALVNLKPSE